MTGCRGHLGSYKLLQQLESHLASKREADDNGRRIAIQLLAHQLCNIISSMHHVMRRVQTKARSRSAMTAEINKQRPDITVSASCGILRKSPCE